MRISKRSLSIMVLLMAAIPIVVFTGNPSLWDRTKESDALISCLDRNGCWDYERRGCLFARPPTPRSIEPTPEQEQTQQCYPNGDGEAAAEKTKHLRL